MIDLSYSEDFKYGHDNPYHDRLEAFSDFVLRDKEGEVFKGKWNKGIFKNDFPIYLEIGTGYGQFMSDFCQQNPQINFVGMDHRFKRSFKLAQKLEKINHRNFRYLRAKGERVQFIFEDNEIDKVFYFFPDPWPKNRHNKKRLFQKHFLENLFRILKSRGILYIKTDHDIYMDWMERVVEETGLFKVNFRGYDLHKDSPGHFLSSFTTKFEKIFLKQNIRIKALELESLKNVN